MSVCIINIYVYLLNPSIHIIILLQEDVREFQDDPRTDEEVWSEDI